MAVKRKVKSCSRLSHENSRNHGGSNRNVGTTSAYTHTGWTRSIAEELVYKRTCCYGAILTLCIKLPFVSTLAYKCPVRCTKFNHVYLFLIGRKTPVHLNDSYHGTETDQYNIILRARACVRIARSTSGLYVGTYTHFMSTWSR
jgi:hypothetical protein